ncbi:hypothetical protein EVJ58_g7468 [Rhodofomes roseus]|uniref:Cytochrome P450 n=1 Tax=Rhodofomes roseus TaxID=34475 RepID=A0A4Y9Y7C5_9APHY|nr:hypothetical protein EVJ58_g7468 [Rhodofomes roseus]
MVLESALHAVLPTHVLLKVVGLVGLGLLLRELLSYIRLRVALLSVSKIPGPPAQSYWTGNLKQLIARDAEEFQQHVALDYGPVTKLNGFFGEPILYVSDPKALHSILIKDEHVFQEGKEFLA